MVVFVFCIETEVVSPHFHEEGIKGEQTGTGVCYEQGGAWIDFWGMHTSRGEMSLRTNARSNACWLVPGFWRRPSARSAPWVFLEHVLLQ